MSYFKINLLMILHTNLYHFILKYNIYIFVYKLQNLFKIRMATVEAIFIRCLLGLKPPKRFKTLIESITLD